MLRDLERPARVAAINLAEVIDQLVRVSGWDASGVQDRLDLLELGGLVALATDRRLAVLGGHVRASFYNRKTCQVSLADCVAVATAQDAADSLATSDPDLAAVARQLGVVIIPLPDSEGRRP